MKSLAFAVRGDDCVLVPYVTRADGHHVFEFQGELHFVGCSQPIAPTIVTDMTQLVDPGDVKWPLRGRLERQWAQAASHGVNVRYFRQFGEGWMELPMAGLMDGIADFWDECTKEAVQVNERGVAVMSRRLVALPDGSTITSVENLARRLSALGLPPDQCLHAIRLCVETQRAGQAETFVRNDAVTWLGNVPEQSYAALIGAGLYGMLMGMELAVNTPLGALYSTGSGTNFVLITTGVLFAGYALWKVIARK